MFKFKMSNEINVIEAMGILIALIFSILSYRSSAYNTNYAINKDIEENKESVAVIFDTIGYDEYVRYNVAGPYRGQGLVGVKYAVFISNNSKQRISILKYDIYQKINNSSLTYSNMLENVLDSNNKKVLFPVSLEAGDSIRLILDLNVSVPQSVNMLVLDKFGVQSRIRFDELRDYLGEKGTDIFGNNLKYTKYGDGKVSVEIEESRFPTYVFSLTTSKNNIFTQTISQNNRE